MVQTTNINRAHQQTFGYAQWHAKVGLDVQRAGCFNTQMQLKHELSRAETSRFHMHEAIILLCCMLTWLRLSHSDVGIPVRTWDLLDLPERAVVRLFFLRPSHCQASATKAMATFEALISRSSKQKPLVIKPRSFLPPTRKSLLDDQPSCVAT